MTDTVSKSRAESKSEVKSGIGKIFMNGRSQAVRIPKEFRLPGNEVRITRMEDGGILLEPIKKDLDYWFEQLQRLGDDGFMAEGRQQPVMPPGIDWDDPE
ncbi:MAG: antitoxin [Thermomicrobiales bacterium]